jgi:hypothetical protein
VLLSSIPFEEATWEDGVLKDVRVLFILFLNKWVILCELFSSGSE